MTDIHYCEIHDTIWFKTEKMRGYAHPVKNDKGESVLNEKNKQVWCNETEEDEQPAPISPPKATVVNEKPANLKNRSFALAYYKDVVVALIKAGVVKELTEQMNDQILKRSEQWSDWLDGK